MSPVQKGLNIDYPTFILNSSIKTGNYVLQQLRCFLCFVLRFKFIKKQRKEEL